MLQFNLVLQILLSLLILKEMQLLFKTRLLSGFKNDLYARFIIF